MNASETSAARPTPPHPQPTTAEELLDHEEALALQKIADSARRLGDDVCAAADLRRRIRRHPLLASGLGVFVGYVGGPLFLRAFERILALTSSVPAPAARRPHTLPGLVLASLRVVRARR